MSTKFGRRNLHVRILFLLHEFTKWVALQANSNRNDLLLLPPDKDSEKNEMPADVEIDTDHVAHPGKMKYAQRQKDQ